jgi:hypothetical protein
MATIQEINSSIIQGTFTNDQLDSIIMAVKFARGQLVAKNKINFVRGSKVKFTSSRKGEIQGTVEKVNRKYVIVREQTNSAFGMQWRVPANMLEAA